MRCACATCSRVSLNMLDVLLAMFHIPERHAGGNCTEPFGRSRMLDGHSGHKVRVLAAVCVQVDVRTRRRNHQYHPYTPVDQH